MLINVIDIDGVVGAIIDHCVDVARIADARFPVDGGPVRIANVDS